MKKYHFIKSISIFISLCFFLSFFSCQKESETTLESSDELSVITQSEVVSEDYESNETEVSEIIINEKTPNEKMEDGEIKINISTGEDYLKFADWICANFYKKYGEPLNTTFNTYDFPRLNEFSIKILSYKSTFVYDKKIIDMSFYAICGILPDAPDEHILIDVKTTDKGYSTFQQVVNIVFKNPLFENFTDKKIKDVFTDGISILDIDNLIGKNREIYYSIPVNSSIAAIISGNEKKDLKCDFINIEYGKIIGNSFQLTDLKTQGYTVMYNGDSQTNDENNIQFSFNVIKNDNKTEYTLWYDLSLKNNNITEKIIFKTGFNEVFNSLYSDSGRYYVFKNNKDLYLHDNLTDKDLLVFDRKPDDEVNANVEDYCGAQGKFFDGDILYYTIYGWEICIGAGIFDPEKNVSVISTNRMSVEKIMNGYAYGSIDIGSYISNYGRFKVSDFLYCETLLENDFHNLFNSNIIYSPENNYISKITKDKYYDNILLTDNTSSVTIYQDLPFGEIAIYNFTTPKELLIYDSFFIGDYIYVPYKDTDNKAYIIKFK